MRGKMSEGIKILKFDVFIDGEEGSMFIATCNTFQDVLDMLNDLHETFWSNDCYGNVIGFTIRVKLEEVGE